MTKRTKASNPIRTREKSTTEPRETRTNKQKQLTPQEQIPHDPMTKKYEATYLKTEKRSRDHNSRRKMSYAKLLKNPHEFYTIKHTTDYECLLTVNDSKRTIRRERNKVRSKTRSHFLLLLSSSYHTSITLPIYN